MWRGRLFLICLRAAVGLPINQGIGKGRISGRLRHLIADR
jgi:hypothetical protein